ncbi:MAG: succinate dehydrogenase, hydrophobic membrane anchor protein [Candidatus Pelagibacter sp. TMED202]|nr:MAG: succinate dehydrogenase, hydrophobic membrane anchor protein [Candidatus Pelagibacter sp. TMED202]
MHKSTKKWLLIKFSSLMLIPFMAWFIINFISILNNDYNKLIAFLSEQPSKILFSIFVFLSLFFYSLTISEIFEDYMSNEKIKNVANKLVYIFAIVLFLGTIITIYKL